MVSSDLHESPGSFQFLHPLILNLGFYKRFSTVPRTNVGGFKPVSKHVLNPDLSWLKDSNGSLSIVETGLIRSRLAQHYWLGPI